MQDPKKPVEPETSDTPAETAPRTGGFGAFADVYRARWAATHPNMRPREHNKQMIGKDDTTSPKPDPSRVHTEDGTRVFHLEDPS
jgi:hypothetical protein